MNRDLLAVVGARPNFVKVAPVLHALREHAINPRVLHTGQHYDRPLSAAILEQLDFPAVEFSLDVGSGSHAEQTGAVMVGVERVLKKETGLSTVLVAGDVNSTMAAAIAAAKLGVRVVHLESGLRSGDWEMPEEINRALTDRVSDLLLCHSREAVENLSKEGVPRERIRLVGNTMIDSLFKLLPAAQRTDALSRLGLTPGSYVLVTLHRPALVDDRERFGAILEVLGRLADRVPVLIPLHPRTRARLEDHDMAALSSLRVENPLGYLDFVAVEAAARLVITDSGGVQEEASALGVPCLTYRTTTERPVTITHGTNRVVGVDPPALELACEELLAARLPASAPPIPHWDGRAGSRAAEAIAEAMGVWAKMRGGRAESAVR